VFVWIFLDVDCLEGSEVPTRPYIVWGIGLHENTSWILANWEYVTIFLFLFFYLMSGQGLKLKVISSQKTLILFQFSEWCISQRTQAYQFFFLLYVFLFICCTQSISIVLFHMKETIYEFGHQIMIMKATLVLVTLHYQI